MSPMTSELRGIKVLVSPQSEVSERIEPLSIADQDPAFYSAFPHAESRPRRARCSIRGELMVRSAYNRIGSIPP